MQKVQIYIEGQRIDLFEDETITLTQTIQNVRDIEKIFTDYSQSFTIPASKDNNKIFKHYYKNDILDGFDGRKKVSATIELNNTVFQEGKVKLLGTNLKNNNVNSYNIVFFGSAVTLKDLLGEDKLQSLDLSAHDTVYSSSQIESNLVLDPTTNDLIVPLISHTGRFIYDSSSSTGNSATESNLYYPSGGGTGNPKNGVSWDNLKYAIRVDEIIQAIGVKYGLTFSTDFFNSSNEHYYNLFLWLHRKKGDVENLDGGNSSIVDGFTLEIDEDTESKIITSSALRLSGTPSDYNVSTIKLYTTSTSTYSASIQLDGVDVYSTGDVTGNQTISTLWGLEAGDYTITISSSSNITFSDVEWYISYLAFNKTYSTGTYNYTSLFNFTISQQIPEIKNIDFLTGIFRMFNLTAFVNVSGDIVVKTLDDFYTSGTSFDITKYVNTDKSSVNVALPYKEITFEHADTDTILSANHSQLFGKTWGKEHYEGGEKLDGSIYSVKTPFSQMKYERLVDASGGINTDILAGYSIDDNLDSYIGKPLLFYPILHTGTNISFLQSDTVNVSKSSYNVPSNSVSLVAGTSKENMNFFAEVNEYTGTSEFTDTLFQSYYSNYIESVFNIKNRITKVTVNLPLRILLTYTLADKFVINGNSYKINSITTNLTTGISTMELLNDL